MPDGVATVLENGEVSSRYFTEIPVFHCGVKLSELEVSRGLSILYRLFDGHRWKDMGGVDGALRELVGNIGDFMLLELFDADKSGQ